VILALFLASCASTGRQPVTLPAAAPIEQPPEAVSLLGRPLYAQPAGADIAKLEANLARARAELDADPTDADRLIWVARRLGYLWRMNESVEVLTRAISLHPNDARLYRHRGHRYISLRRFNDAEADLRRAAELIAGRPEDVEPDGAPNARGVPLTTTAFNVWYHLGLARYLKGDSAGALEAYRETMKHTRGYDDNLVAVTDWMYMTLRRLGRDEEAAALLDPIHPQMDIIENRAYHRRLLMYKGLLEPDALLSLETAGDLDLATRGYGLGFWHWRQGDGEGARATWERVVTGPYWPAFGFIAAEVELSRMRR
jgi:tetratricopeptide (TPR) repeat protein